MTGLTNGLALTIVGAPAALLAILGASALTGGRMPERVAGALVKLAFVLSLASCLALAPGFVSGDVAPFSTLDSMPADMSAALASSAIVRPSFSRYCLTCRPIASSSNLPCAARVFTSFPGRSVPSTASWDRSPA